MENGILVEYKDIDMPTDNTTNASALRKKWMPTNIGEYFFFDEFGYLNMNELRIQQCYTEFTQTMTFIYDNMKTHYVKFT